MNFDVIAATFEKLLSDSSECFKSSLGYKVQERSYHTTIFNSPDRIKFILRKGRDANGVVDDYHFYMVLTDIPYVELDAFDTSFMNKHVRKAVKVAAFKDDMIAIRSSSYTHDGDSTLEAIDNIIVVREGEQVGTLKSQREQKDVNFDEILTAIADLDIITFFNQFGSKQRGPITE